MSARPALNIHGYLITLRQDPFSASTVWGKILPSRAATVFSVLIGTLPTFWAEWIFVMEIFIFGIVQDLGPRFLWAPSSLFVWIISST